MPALIRRTSSSDSESVLGSTTVTGLTIASFVLLVIVAALAGRLLRTLYANRRATSARRSLILSRIQRSQQNAMDDNGADGMQHVGFEFRGKEMRAIYDDYVRDQGGLPPTPFSRHNITPDVVFPVKAPTRSTPPSPKDSTFGQIPSAAASTSSLVSRNGSSSDDLTPSVFLPSVLIRGQPRPHLGNREISPPTSP